MKHLVVIAFSVLSLGGCASLGNLGQLIKPPRFEQVREQPGEILLRGVSADAPAGGATVRIWTRVTNPNPFGFTLSTLRTTLLLGGTRAATGDFPLGLPLQAAESTVIPLELTISFSELPALTHVVRAAVTGGRLEYQLDGTMGIDAGALGTPVFGPLRLIAGELRARR